MDGAALRAKLKDALITMPVVWMILIGTGYAFSWLQPGTIGALLSLVVCTALLFSWGHWTDPGRRTGLPVYLLAGLLYLALMWAILFILPMEMIDKGLTLFGGGLAIGFQLAGGPDAPGELYFLPILFNLFGPILVMGILRQLAQRDREDRA